MTGGKAMGGIQRELGLNFPLQDENGPAEPEDITEEKGVVWGAPASGASGARLLPLPIQLRNRPETSVLPGPQVPAWSKRPARAQG